MLCSSRDCSEEMRQKLEEERQDHNKTKDDDKVFDAGMDVGPWAGILPTGQWLFLMGIFHEIGHGDSIGILWDR